MEVQKMGKSSYVFLCHKSAQSNFTDELTIYKKGKVFLYINLFELKIYLNSEGGGEKELSFPEFIRFIDTLPDKTPEWKRKQILLIATELGVFGL